MTHEQLLRIYWAANPGLRLQGVTQKGETVTGQVYEWRFEPFHTLHGLGSYEVHFSTLKPHLKPLSSITDEDAIAVAKMAIPGSGHFNIIKSDGGILIRCHKDGHFLKFWIEYHNGFVLKIYGDRDYEPPVNNPNQITDYLRSKSYNLDFEDANYIKI